MLLTTEDEEPGEEVKVKNKRTEEIEVAEVDEDGVVRDNEGRAYSSGAYKICG